MANFANLKVFLKLDRRANYERIEDDPDEYCVVCSCGESFDFCGLAIYHVDEEH